MVCTIRPRFEFDLFLPDRSASAEFRRVDRTVQIHNATEVPFPPPLTSSMNTVSLFHFGLAASIGDDELHEQPP